MIGGRREMVLNGKTPLCGLKKWGFSVWGDALN